MTDPIETLTCIFFFSQAQLFTLHGSISKVRQTDCLPIQMRINIRECKQLEDAQGALQFKVLPEYLCPSPGVQLTHKITEPNGCLTQTAPSGCLCCAAKMQSATNRPRVIAGAFQKSHNCVNTSDLGLRYKGALIVG